MAVIVEVSRCHRASIAQGRVFDGGKEVDAENNPLFERLQNGWRHAAVLRMVRGVRANRLRIQERVVMGSLLPVWVGPRYNGRTTIRARIPARAVGGR